jgi:hypothetical protein
MLVENKKIIVSVTLIAVFLIGLIVAVAIILSNRKTEDKVVPDPDNNDNNNNTICVNNPSDCNGVPEAVRTYITNTYTQIDEVRSLLQVSRSLGLITPTNSTNLTRDQLVSSYRDITRSV